MTCRIGAAFAAELKARGFKMKGNRIISDECPGISWKPVMTRGRIDRVRTLRKVVRERRDEIVRQLSISMV